MALCAGYIGLGNIGKPMASCWVEAGFETAVYDLAEAPVAELVALGARAAPSPRAVGEAAEVIGICVRDDDDVRAVSKPALIQQLAIGLPMFPSPM